MLVGETKKVEMTRPCVNISGLPRAALKWTPPEIIEAADRCVSGEELWKRLAG